MPFFAVTYTYTPEPQRLDRARPEHRAYLRRLAEAGQLRASGPCATDPPSALLLFVAADEDELARLIADDPFHQAELVPTWTATRWHPVIGVFADEVS